jgi:calcineurin-like phosphoesterase family protein
MTTYFTSDTHFGHQRIIELSNRPFNSVDEMNEAMIDNWNNVVSDDDVVYHLGDVALGPWVEWDSILTRLNGYKVLIVGNHDRVFKGMATKQQEKFASEYDKWFDEFYDNDYIYLGDNDEPFNLSHFPYDGDSQGDERYREHRLTDNGRVLIHGHTHMNQVISYSDKGTMQVHVGVDAHDFNLVSEEQIINYVEVARNAEV